MAVALIYIFMILAILCAVFALESKHLMLSIIGLIAMNLCVWIVFLTFNADLIAWIQLIVYGGGLTALFLVVVVLTETQTDDSFDVKRTIIGAIVAGAFVGVIVGVFIVFQGAFTFDGASDNIDAITLLWTQRPTDLIIQAVMFMVTSIAIGSMFIQHKKQVAKEETKA